MRALVAGSAGQLGRELVARLGDEVAWKGDRAELDVADGAAVVALVARVRPDVVFNATAFNRVDAAETDSEINAEAARAVLGLNTLLPLNLELRAWVDSDGGARGSLEKRLPLTPRLEVEGAVRYDTHDLWEGHAGFAFTLSKRASLLARWHSTFGLGAGAQLRF